MIKAFSKIVGFSVLMAAASVAQNTGMRQDFRLASLTCTQNPLAICLVEIDGIIEQINQQFSGSLKDDALGTLVFELTESVTAGMADQVFANIAAAIRRIAAEFSDPEQINALLIIASIIEQRELFLVEPSRLLASVN